MSLDEKIGQLFIVPVCPTHGQEHLEKVSNLIRERHIGGVIFMAGDSNKQRELIQAFQSKQDIPLWTFQDAEWGIGMRLQDISSLPKNLTLGAIEDLELLRAFGLELARQCRSVGIWGDFAPVVDVNSNPNNPVIHQRSFGEDSQEVAKKALAVMQGMQEGGILACAKHFPGHGDTAMDSHSDLPKIDKSFESICETELAPFKALIDARVDMVMVGHLYFPTLSEMPSSLSSEIISGLLRKKLGFKGLIVTDALNMKALSERYPMEEIFKKALLAGSDLLVTSTAKPEESTRLIETDIPQAIELIKKTVPEKVIDERVARILEAKKKTLPQMPLENPDLRRELYRYAVTQIGGKVRMKAHVALVQSRPDPDFEKFLKRYCKLTCFSFEEMEKARGFSNVIVNVRKGDLPSAIPAHCVVALFDTPYTLHKLQYTRALVGYEDEPEAKEAVSDVLFGKLTPLGKLPIQLSNKLEKK